MELEQVEIAETPTGAVLVPAEPAPSIADHASQFSPEAQEKAAEAPAADLKPVRPVDQQRRTEAGQFTEGQKRIKAKDAVDRINQLTGRAKTAEERLAVAEAEVARLKTQHAPPAQVAAAERKVEQADTRVPVKAETADPEPTEDDPKYGGDYAKYLRDVTKWETRQAIKADRAETEQRATQVKREEAQTATIRTFAERLTAAKDKYDDFEATLQWDAPWLAKSGEPHPGYEATHAFVMEDEAGADVLQYLRTHPDELDALLRVPPLQQVKRLTLLGQRFASQTLGTAGTTRSAPERKIVNLPPKPPNLVRTEVQSHGNHPPPTDGSLSIADHGRAFSPKRR